MFKIIFLLSPMDPSYSIKEAKLSIDWEFGKEIAIEFMDTYMIDKSEEEFTRCINEIKASDLVFISIHGGLTQFMSFEKIMDEFQGKKKFFIHSGCEDENTAVLKRTGITQREYNEILKYKLTGTTENYRNMILYTATNFGNKKYKYNPPKLPVWEGIYYPGKDVKDMRAYIDEIKITGKPVVGILFLSKHMHENNLLHIDRFIKEVEDAGGVPLAVYTSSTPNPLVGCRGFQWTIDNILMDCGEPVVDVIINTISYSQSILSSPGDGTKTVEKSIYEQLNIPVLQAMTTYQSYETWEKALNGLDTMSLIGSVYFPEFDGQIISATTAYSEFISDEIGEKIVSMPIPERVNKVSRLALNWAKLKRKNNKDKKVAIIFHNMPPRNDMIGCAYGLDTPKCVFDMVKRLKEEGIYTEYDFENGDEIINKIIAGVSNDTRWLTAEQVLEKSVDTIPGDLYREWFSNLPEDVKEKMLHDWDTPPGEFMVYDDRIPVPGIVNGNIFIGLQPPRGYEENAEEVYHSTDIVPPHQYIAFYKWIKRVFKADVIAHIGTHGTLEWLPGKEIGLSEKCYTDIVIDDMPHLYPYSINVVGEGIQAKRRGSAVILDHLIPSLMQSGTYGEIDEIDELIRQYFHAKQGDKGKLTHIKSQIIDLVVRNNFHIDLNISVEKIEADFENFMEVFHGWVEEIKNSLIKDGLHLFGQVPEGERLENLICALLRLPNGNIPSLNQGVCRAYNLNYDYLKNNPYETDNSGRTNLMILDEIEETGRKIIKKLHQGDYKEETIEKIISETFGYVEEDKLSDIIKILKFTINVIKPKLDGTTDEIENFINGINGRFILPGASGSPTRGRVNILPTGRNFYSLDPTSVPTKASWEIGKQLGDNLIKRYIKDEGKYPETVVIIVYAGETMKTCGDDIAEILYLMGIKPKWLENTDKVIGLEVIPIEELGRPRIDVTLRISGLFRDTFPNIIELIEDAVNLAAGLDEGEDVNYIRKNVLNEVKELVGNGMPFEEAHEEATMRIFGCPPGTYGAGVDILINSKNWNNLSDLGNIYTLWSGHAYGRKVHGRKVQDVLSRRLASAQVTVKNESSMEIDILDSDDFYNYHGGLIAAVTTNSGEKPRSYCGNTSDLERTKIKDVREEIAKIMRSRILNPKWFEGLKQHGYKGAQEISGMVDFIFGWDATSDVVEDWMYEKISETYLFDDEKREWIKGVNPWAIHSMVERLLEANQRGIWNAEKESIEKLREIYLSIEGDIEEHI